MDSLLQAIKAPMIQSGNWLLSLTFLTVWASIHYVAVKRWDLLSGFAKRAVSALFPVAIGLSIYFPWFALSRKFAQAGETHNLWMTEWRWAMISVVSLLCACGMSRFVCLIFGASEKSHWLLWAALIAAALLVGLS